MAVGSKTSTFRTIARSITSTKGMDPSRKNNCQGQDSNLQAFRHQILSLARLPISPPWPVNVRLWILDFGFPIARTGEHRLPACRIRKLAESIGITWTKMLQAGAPGVAAGLVLAHALTTESPRGDESISAITPTERERI